MVCFWGQGVGVLELWAGSEALHNDGQAAGGWGLTQKCDQRFDQQFDKTCDRMDDQRR
jgi:hypothetical protein